MTRGGFMKIRSTHIWVIILRVYLPCILTEKRYYFPKFKKMYRNTKACLSGPCACVYIDFFFLEHVSTKNN